MESQRIERTEPVYHGIHGRIYPYYPSSGKPGTAIRAYPGEARSAMSTTCSGWFAGYNAHAREFFNEIMLSSCW
jgi:hypothetical protein